MADAVEIVRRLRAIGANVVLTDTGLRIVNRDKLPAGSAEFIAEHRDEIADVLRDEADAIEERAAIIEFDGNTPREWAEQAAKMLAQTPSPKVDRFAMAWWRDRVGDMLDMVPLERGIGR